jgi:type I restriction enzyme S subunit
MGFKTTLITNLFHLKQGTYLSPSQMKKSQSQEFCYPVYGANGVIGFSNRKMYSERTTLVSCRGANCGVIHYTKPNAWISNNSIACIPKSEADPTFYYYLCSNSIFNDVITGAAQPQITITNLSSKKLIHPPLPTQKKIAGILSAYDDLIENNLKRIKLLEEMAQITYEEWFVRLRFPGHTTTPINEATGLPEGWEITTLGKIIDKLESGSRPKGGIDKTLIDGVPSVGAENVIGLGKYKFDSEKLVSEEFFLKMKRGVICQKDILIYKDGAYIGKTSMFQDGFPHKKFAVNEHVFLINTKENFYQNYLYFTLSREDYFLKMQGLNSNSAQPGLNQEKIGGLEVVKVENGVIEKFNRVVEPLVTKIFNLAKTNQRLREARDILLPRLMTGVIDAEKYQPEKLLKEIA